MRSKSTKSISDKTEEFDVSEIESASNIILPDDKTQSTSHPATLHYPPLSTTSSSSSLKTIAPLSPISQSGNSKLKTSLSTTTEGAFNYFCIRGLSYHEKKLEFEITSSKI